MKGTTQEKMDRGSRGRCPSDGGEKMEIGGGKYKRMDGHFSTGQSSKRAVEPMEEEEEEEE